MLTSQWSCCTIFFEYPLLLSCLCLQVWALSRKIMVTRITLEWLLHTQRYAIPETACSHPRFVKSVTRASLEMFGRVCITARGLPPLSITSIVENRTVTLRKRSGRLTALAVVNPTRRFSKVSIAFISQNGFPVYSISSGPFLVLQPLLSSTP